MEGRRACTLVGEADRLHQPSVVVAVVVVDAAVALQIRSVFFNIKNNT